MTVTPQRNECVRLEPQLTTQDAVERRLLLWLRKYRRLWAPGQQPHEFEIVARVSSPLDGETRVRGKISPPFEVTEAGP